MNALLPSFRRELRARAHGLHPVVSIGQHGLTPAVLHEIDVALLAHELVKVRVFSDDRAARTAMLEQTCKELDCAAVQQIGKLLVLWRARPPSADAPSAKPRRERSTATPPPAGVASRRRRAPSQDAPGTARSPGGRGREVAVSAPRPRPPGKAPPGVPRAAAPRRRRRGA